MPFFEVPTIKSVLEPLVKWSGSKRSQAKDIISAIPHSYETYYEQHMLTIPTKSGKHIIVQPFNKKEFSDKWSSAGLAHLVPCDIHKDNPTILYIP